MKQEFDRIILDWSCSLSQVVLTIVEVLSADGPVCGCMWLGCIRVSFLAPSALFGALLPWPV